MDFDLAAPAALSETREKVEVTRLDLFFLPKRPLYNRPYDLSQIPQHEFWRAKQA